MVFFLAYCKIRFVSSLEMCSVIAAIRTCDVRLAKFITITMYSVYHTRKSLY